MICSANPAVNKFTALEMVQAQIECCLESIDFESDARPGMDRFMETFAALLTCQTKGCQIVDFKASLLISKRTRFAKGKQVPTALSTRHHLTKICSWRS